MSKQHWVEYRAVYKRLRHEQNLTEKEGGRAIVYSKASAAAPSFASFLTTIENATLLPPVLTMAYRRQDGPGRLEEACAIGIICTPTF